MIMPSSETGNRRVVSVWFPRFATDRLARSYRAARWREQSRKTKHDLLHRQRQHEQRRSEQSGQRQEQLAQPDALLGKPLSKEAPPFATVHLVRGGHRLAAVDETATSAGLFPGLPLADARSRVPMLQTAPSDVGEDHKAIRKLAFWTGRYTPWTAVDDTAPKQNDAATDYGHGLWLDISGCAHLFGGENALLVDLTDRLAVAGYRNRVAVADTLGAAWALARFGPDGNRQSSPTTPQTILRKTIAPLSILGLRLDVTTVEALTRLGLCHIGDLYPFARADLVRRFGLMVAMRLDQALGDRDEPLSPLQPPPVRQVRLKFPEPIGRADDIRAVLDRLLPALADRLAQAGEGARRLDFTLYRVDGTTATVSVGTSQPEREPEHLSRLFREKLADMDPGFGVETALLAARAVEPFIAVQKDLKIGQSEQAVASSNAPQALNCDADHGDLGRLIDRLANRLGSDQVLGLMAQESHLPEQAQRLHSLTRNNTAGATDSHTDMKMRDKPPLEGGQAPTAPRPVYLLPVPEPVDVLCPGPHDPPVMLRWRGRQHRLICAEGPERIAPEWRLDLILGQQGDDQEDEMNRGQVPESRDYYRVEDDAGERFWLYRQNQLSSLAGFGLSILDGQPYKLPKWYLHGLFS